jgi:hypothetical protein
VSALLTIGFISMFFKGYKNMDRGGKILCVVASLIFLGMFLFVNINEYGKEQDAKKVRDTTEPIYYIKIDTLELYKIDGRYYRYAPRMHQFVFFGNVNEDNIISDQNDR